MGGAPDGFFVGSASTDAFSWDVIHASAEADPTEHHASRASLIEYKSVARDGARRCHSPLNDPPDRRKRLLPVRAGLRRLVRQDVGQGDEIAGFQRRLDVAEL